MKTIMDNNENNGWNDNEIDIKMKWKNDNEKDNENEWNEMKGQWNNWLMDNIMK